MDSDLTKRQKEIFDFIKSEILAKGYPPSVREIGEAVGLKSTSTVHGHLDRLEKKGYIRRDPTKPRTIEITDNSFTPIRHEMVSIPVLGKVAAGNPILAIEETTDYFPIPLDYIGNANENLFILEVQGESMINAGILDGDLLIVRQEITAKDGDIIVALIDDAATVKTYYKEDDMYRLQPENDTMAPIYTKELSIIGKVIGLYRRY